MAVSGWCSTHGKPQCRWCRSTLCSHECHTANPAQPRGLLTVPGVDSWDNKGEPDRSVSALQPGSDHLPEIDRKGLVS